ncbi:hypothetical protein KM043_006885 [Ampulex compressa]|nr:hypothetical protein KM043_006885 [Ampulex compressa]
MWNEDWQGMTEGVGGGKAAECARKGSSASYESSGCGAREPVERGRRRPPTLWRIPYRGYTHVLGRLCALPLSVAPRWSKRKLINGAGRGRGGEAAGLVQDAEEEPARRAAWWLVGGWFEAEGGKKVTDSPQITPTMPTVGVSRRWDDRCCRPTRILERRPPRPSHGGWKNIDRTRGYSAVHLGVAEVKHSGGLIVRPPNGRRDGGEHCRVNTPLVTYGIISRISLGPVGQPSLIAVILVSDIIILGRSAAPARFGPPSS